MRSPSCFRSCSRRTRDDGTGGHPGRRDLCPSVPIRSRDRPSRSPGALARRGPRCDSASLTPVRRACWWSASTERAADALVELEDWVREYGTPHRVRHPRGDGRPAGRSAANAPGSTTHAVVRFRDRSVVVPETQAELVALLVERFGETGRRPRDPCALRHGRRQHPQRGGEDRAAPAEGHAGAARLAPRPGAGGGVPARPHRLTRHEAPDSSGSAERTSAILFIIVGRPGGGAMSAPTRQPVAARLPARLRSSPARRRGSASPSPRRSPTRAGRS